MQLIILLTVLSLAPAILIMMTSFTRIIIVMSLLRQALGTQQLPPNQMLIGLSLFMTFLVMGPTWEKVNDEALQPYLNGDDRAARGARARAGAAAANSCAADRQERQLGRRVHVRPAARAAGRARRSGTTSAR